MNTSAAPRPDRPDARRQALMAGMALMALALIAVLLGWVLRVLPAAGAGDLSVVVAANRSLNESTTRIAVGVDLLFGPVFAGALVAFAALLSGLLHRSRWAGVRTVLLIAVPWSLVELIKLLVQRPRPDGGLLLHQLVPGPLTFSYPSGHTAVAAAFCTAIVLALPAGWPRRLTLAPSVLLVLVTAWSRVALGVHHPSDVLVSLLLVPVLCLLVNRLLGLLRPDELPRHEGQRRLDGIEGIAEDVTSRR